MSKITENSRTPTPRCDEVVTIPGTYPSEKLSTWWVKTEFAKELERALTAALADKARLEEVLRAKYNRLDARMASRGNFGIVPLPRHCKAHNPYLAINTYAK